MAKLISISVEEFKSIENTELIQIVKNPNTSKLFAACGNGRKFKVQGNIDVTKPISFMHDTDGAWDEGCFVNSGQDNVVHTM